MQDAALGFAGTAVLVGMHLEQSSGAQGLRGSGAQGLRGSGAYDTYAGMFLHRHGSKGEGLYLAQHSFADPPGVLIVLLQACQRPPTTSMMPTCC